MYKPLLKFFLWYSKQLGYDVSVSRERDNNYEFYSNTKIVQFEPKEELYIKPILPPIEILAEREIPKRNKFRTNSKISYLDLKKVESAGGIAILISKKVNELANAVNLINIESHRTPE